MNRDQVNGHTNEAERKIKEVAGRPVGSEQLELKGMIQKTLGEAQSSVGDINQCAMDTNRLLRFAARMRVLPHLNS